MTFSIDIKVEYIIEMSLYKFCYMSEGNEGIYCYTLELSFSSDRAQIFFAYVSDPQEQESTMKILSMCPPRQKDSKRDLQAKVMDRSSSNFVCTFVLVHTTIQYKKIGNLDKTTPPPRGTCIFFGSLKFQKKASVGQSYGRICFKFCMQIHFSTYYIPM